MPASQSSEQTPRNLTAAAPPGRRAAASPRGVGLLQKNGEGAEGTAVPPSSRCCHHRGATTPRNKAAGRVLRHQDDKKHTEGSSAVLLAWCWSRRAPQEGEEHPKKGKSTQRRGSTSPFLLTSPRKLSRTKCGARSLQEQGANVFCVLCLPLRGLQESSIIQDHSAALLFHFYYPLNGEFRLLKLHNKACLFLRTVGIAETDRRALGGSINRRSYRQKTSHEAGRKERAGVS